MVLNSLKKTFSAFSKRPGYFLKIAVLDILFFAVIIAVTMLILPLFVQEASSMIQAMQDAQGTDAAQKITASSYEVSQHAFAALKLMILFMIVAYVLFTMFFGFTSFLIAKSKEKKIGFIRYIRQYAVITLVLSLVLIVLSSIIANVIVDIRSTGISVHSLLWMLFVIASFSMTAYVLSLAYALLPDSSFFILLKKAFHVAFIDSRQRLLSFFIVLMILLAIILAIKYASALHPLVGIFLLILLFFPYSVFARLFLIEVVKR